MIDVRLFAISLKCKWVKLYLDGNDSLWKVLFDEELKKYGKGFLFECNFSKKDINISNVFIRDVCYAWSDFNFRSPDSNFYGNQSVLNNSFIKIDNILIYSNILRRKEAFKLHLFFDQDGNALDYNSFCMKYDLNRFPFTLYFGILSAIPSSWKKSINCVHIQNENEQRLTKAISLPKITKYVYNYLVKEKSQVPKAIFKWQDIDYKVYDWNQIFMLPYIAVRDTKLHYFQFRFLQRILGVNNFLYRIKIKESSLCTFCHEVNETLEHLFWECDYVKLFWSEICNLCLKSTFEIDFNYIKFGKFEDAKHPINFFILHGKYYIFNCKLNNNIPDAIAFSYKFKYYLNVEYYILSKASNVSRITLFKEMFIL